MKTRFNLSIDVPMSRNTGAQDFLDFHLSVLESKGIKVNQILGYREVKTVGDLSNKDLWRIWRTMGKPNSAKDEIWDVSPDQSEKELKNRIAQATPQDTVDNGGYYESIFLVLNSEGELETLTADWAQGPVDVPGKKCIWLWAAND